MVCQFQKMIIIYIFGNAQSETELTLKPGKHRISLQFADGVHRSYGNKLNTTIYHNCKVILL
jgi:hypothetical protein